MRGNHEAFGLDGGIEGELQFFTGEENRNAGQIHQTSGVIEVHVGEYDPANFAGVAADEAHEFRERHFGIQLTGQIFELDAQKEGISTDFVVEMRGIAGVDEEITGGMLDENASGSHGEGIAGESAAGFDPAGGEAL